MKNPIKLALSLLALGCAVASPALRAQENKTPPPAGGGQGRGPGGRGMMTPEQRIEMLDKAVTLTAEQKTKIAAIYKDSAEKMKALAPEDGREKRMEMMKATQDAVRATLTAEQQAKFDAMPRPGRGGPGGPRGEGRPAGEAPAKQN